MLHTIFSILGAITSLGLFIAYGIPLILGLLFMFYIGFQPGGIFAWSGRMNRLSYLVNYLIALIVYVLSLLLLTPDFLTIKLVGIVGLAGSTFRTLAINSRRFHDIKLPGYWALVLAVVTVILNSMFPTIRYVTDLIILALMLIPARNNNNPYGPMPTKKVEF